MNPPNLLTEWARLLLGSLRQAGVRDAVISPGSRSTPFTHAALTCDGLRARSVIDERDAAFLALGHAKMTGRPVLLVCTSGSAAANYYPAVVEAARSATPLLVLTADRPPELQHADAPQTIDQTRLYGSFARAFIDVGMPDASDAALRGLQRSAAHAVRCCGWPEPGAVHINAPARKPLEPRGPDGAGERELAARVDALIRAGVTRAEPPRILPAEGALERIAHDLASAARALIVCGPAAPWLAPAPGLVHELARRTRSALLPEATSQQRFVETNPDVVVCDAFDVLLRSAGFRERLEPDVVLEIGSPATSTGWRDYIAARPHLRRHVLSATAWSDPHGGAASVCIGPLDSALRSLLASVPAGAAAAKEAAGVGPTDAPAADAPWLEWLCAANEAAWSAVDERLAAEPPGCEGAAVRAAVAALPQDALLAVGNSLPVRELDTFCRATNARVAVWHQRGAAGIDGLVAGATGAAVVTGRPTVLLLGDVSFAHDIGGLAAARDSEPPLAIVVLDNQGGRIFEQLPLARAGSVDEAAWRYWATPPRLDLAAAAAAYGLPHVRIDDPDALGSALGGALDTPGATLIEARLDGSRTIPLQRTLHEDIDERLSTIEPTIPSRP